MSVLALLLHAVLMAAAASLLAGLVPMLRRAFAGQRPGRPAQVWRDWRALLRKTPSVSEGASPLLLACPALCLAATMAAALLVPSFAAGMATAPAADLVAVAGLLALCRVIQALAAMDAGVASHGMEAAAMLRVGTVLAPAAMAALFAVALLSGGTGVDGAIVAMHEAAPLPAVLAVGSLFAMAVALEAAGDPSMAELSGWHLLTAELAVALRRVVVLTLLAGLALPGVAPAGAGALAWLVGMLIWAGKLAVLAPLSAAAAMLAPSRLEALPWAALLLALLAVLFVFTGQVVA